MARLNPSLQTGIGVGTTTQKGRPKAALDPCAVRFLSLTLHHHLLDLCNGLGRIQTLRAGAGAVHDGVAAIETEGVFQRVEALAGCLVAAVDEPAIGLQQRGGTKIAVAIPPIGRAGSGAAGAENALVKPVELFAVFMAL